MHGPFFRGFVRAENAERRGADNGDFFNQKSTAELCSASYDSELRIDSVREKCDETENRNRIKEQSNRAFIRLYPYGNLTPSNRIVIFFLFLAHLSTLVLFQTGRVEWYDLEKYLYLIIDSKFACQNVQI